SWNRRRQRTQERRAAVVDFPAQEHRVVLVHRVMAMLHEHAAPVAELHGNGDGAGRTQAIHVLAPSLPGREGRGASVAREHVTFLEVNVDRMVPAAAALERPDFPGAESRRRRYTAVIGRE